MVDFPFSLAESYSGSKGPEWPRDRSDKEVVGGQLSGRLQNEGFSGVAGLLGIPPELSFFISTYCSVCFWLVVTYLLVCFWLLLFFFFWGGGRPWLGLALLWCHLGSGLRLTGEVPQDGESLKEIIWPVCESPGVRIKLRMASIC